MTGLDNLPACEHCGHSLENHDLFPTGWECKECDCKKFDFDMKKVKFDESGELLLRSDTKEVKKV